MAKEKELTEGAISGAPSVEVTLSLGPAEFVGQHTIFIGGKSVLFHDGTANVPPSQAEELRKHGYIK